IRVRFRDAATREAARGAILANLPDLALAERDDGQDLVLVGTLRPEVQKRVQESAVQQNIGTLHKRVNELGVAEPVIQQQGGGRAMRQTTRENLKRLMAIILFEKGKGEAISVATIQGEFGSRFQITGSFTPSETNNLALLIRAGALAAPMEIIEERTIGPSL